MVQLWHGSVPILAIEANMYRITEVDSIQVLKALFIFKKQNARPMVYLLLLCFHWSARRCTQKTYTELKQASF